MMESIECPVLDCTCPNTDAIVVAALLNAHATTHYRTTSAKVEKVKRPTISTAGSSEEWAYFKTRWDDYKTATKVTSLISKSEAEVLSAIRTLAVREDNTMIARVALHNMQQDQNKPVKNFGARLRGQASVCKFIIPCPSCTADVNYIDEILRDVVTRNISDSEVQLDLLGDSNQIMTLEEVLKFIEVIEV